MTYDEQERTGCAMPYGSFHWWDVIPCVIGLVVLGAALVALGWSIGAGYAWMRHRQERQPEHP